MAVSAVGVVDWRARRVVVVLALVTRVAGIAAFLASDEASYITSATVAVDGGWTAH